MVHVSNEGTKKRRVLDFLAAGNTLTAGQAKSRFNVGNMRATISDIKSQVEKYGNWSVYTHLVRPSTGWTSLVMMITHSPSESVSAN